jgi:hypothetical protein
MGDFFGVLAGLTIAGCGRRRKGERLQVLSARLKLNDTGNYSALGSPIAGGAATGRAGAARRSGRRPPTSLCSGTSTGCSFLRSTTKTAMAEYLGPATSAHRNQSIRMWAPRKGPFLVLALLAVGFRAPCLPCGPALSAHGSIFAPEGSRRADETYINPLQKHTFPSVPCNNASACVACVGCEK